MAYYALTHLVHRDTQEQFEPGATVDLGHLTPEEIQALLDQGAVGETKPKVAPKRKRLDADQEPT